MAAQLLDQITTTSLAEVLQVVSYDLAPPGGTYIDVFDQLLEQASERVEGLGRGQLGFKRGDMVEVQGPTGSGKTETLYWLIMTRVLPYQPTLYPRSPSTHREFPTPLVLGGHQQSALVFSVDASGFSLVRLAALLREYVRSKYDDAVKSAWGETYTDAQRASWIDARAQMEAIVRQSLDRVRVSRIPGADSWVLAAALGRVEETVLEVLGADEELGLVCVDGFGAGYWQDAFARSTASLTTRRQPTLAQTPMYHVLDALTHIRQLFSPLVVLSTQLLPLQPGTQTTHLPFPYTHPFPLPRVSTAIPPEHPRQPPDGLLPITHHVTLQPPPAPPINPQRGLCAAMVDEERRMAGAFKTVVRGKLRVVGDGGREGVWEGRIGGRGLLA